MQRSQVKGQTRLIKFTMHGKVPHGTEENGPISIDSQIEKE